MEVEEKTHARRPSGANPSRSPAGAGASVATGVGSGDRATEVALPAGGNEGVAEVPGRFSVPRWALGFVDVHRRKLFVLILALYLLAFNGQWRLDADSALYLTIGRN